MKINIANPWTRFYLSCGAVVLVFCIFVLLYSLYKHPYYGARFIGINFFKETDKSSLPLYEISEGESCIKLIPAEIALASDKKTAIKEAHSPQCKAAISIPAETKKLEKDGFVELALFIKPDGEVRRVDISQSSGIETLDKLALDQVQNSWKFEPCLKADVAIECRQLVRVRWK